MASVFDVLGHDHVEVKRMLTELEKGPTAATGASDDALALRKKMVQQLVIEESRHEAVEEMYFWPTVRDVLPDGDQLADTATGQEQEAKHVLDRLDKLDAGQPEFEDLIGTFIQSTAPTRPHPHTPPSPGVLKTAGPAVAAADRARDAATGRDE
jgi:hypothetical protein